MLRNYVRSRVRPLLAQAALYRDFTFDPVLYEFHLDHEMIRFTTARLLEHNPASSHYSRTVSTLILTRVGKRYSRNCRQLLRKLDFTAG